MTLVVNLFGAPCSGKSTAAAYIFARLKQRRYNAELVTEFAKDMVYDEMYSAFNEQAYIFGNQLHRLNRCKEVDIVITDSPVLNAIVYNTNPTLGDEFNVIVSRAYGSFVNRNYLMLRAPGSIYSTDGRIHNEIQSEEIEKKIVKVLHDNKVIFTPIMRGDQQAYDQVVEEIIAEYNKIKLNA